MRYYILPFSQRVAAVDAAAAALVRDVGRILDLVVVLCALFGVVVLEVHGVAQHLVELDALGASLGLTGPATARGGACRPLHSLMWRCHCRS